MDATLAIVPTATIPPSTRDIGPIRVGDERLHIPSRVYFPEPEPNQVAGLGGTERVILACIYTRHHDGFVRERYLKSILGRREAWIPPFVLQLLGEYVVEIIQRIAERVDELRNEIFARFAAENSAFVDLTRQRVVSYWNCYYRVTFPMLTAYPGCQVLNALGLWGDHGARLLAAR